MSMHRPWKWLLVSSLGVIVGATSGCLLSAGADALGDITRCYLEPDVVGSVMTQNGSLDFSGFDTLSQISYSTAKGSKKCVNGADLTVEAGLYGCSLTVVAAPLNGGDGLLIDTLALSIDENSCPGAGLPTGTYSASRSSGEIGTINVRGDIVGAGPCIDGKASIDLEAFTVAGPNGNVQIDGGAIELEGAIDLYENLDDCPAKP